MDYLKELVGKKVEFTPIYGLVPTNKTTLIGKLVSVTVETLTKYSAMVNERWLEIDFEYPVIEVTEVESEPTVEHTFTDEEFNLVREVFISQLSVPWSRDQLSCWMEEYLGSQDLLVQFLTKIKAIEPKEIKETNEDKE